MNMDKHIHVALCMVLISGLPLLLCHKVIKYTFNCTGNKYTFNCTGKVIVTKSSNTRSTVQVIAFLYRISWSDEMVKLFKCL